MAEHIPPQPARISGTLPERLADAWDLADQAPEIREYSRTFVKRKWLIAAVFFGVLATTALFTFLAAPVYTAEALLLIERSDPRVIDIESVVGEALGHSEDYYNTQYEILASRALASEVIRELGLDRDERFLGTTGGPWSWLRDRLPVLSDRTAPPEGRTLEDDLAPLIDRYLGQISVEPLRQSRLVKLSFSGTDPELSARVVNSHARAYIRYGLALRTRASEEARSFLQENFDELRERVELSQQALSAFRREHDIVSLDDKADVVIERLADLNERLTEAEADRIAGEAEARVVRMRDHDALPAVLASPLVRELKQELARVEREYASLSSTFTPVHPGLRELRARIEEARRRIDEEVRNIVGGIESSYLAAQAREQELRTQVERQKAQALQLKDTSVQYAVLKHDVEAALNLYDGVRRRTEETSMAAELRASNVSVIDEAYAPRAPSSPRKGPNLVLGALLGLIGGLGLALLVEHLDNRLRTPQEVERHLRLPTLGVVPDFAKLDSGWSRRLLAGVVHPAPRTVVARAKRVELVSAQEPPALIREAYRSIRTDILLSQAGEPPRTLLFSSAAEGEGKTTTVLNTATMFAQLGVPVLVIDADLRKPRCHDLLSLKNEPGLTEALTGRPSELHKVQILDHQLSFLASGARPPNPTELLGSFRMREILRQLRDRFEYILIDAPPLAPVSDAVVLSTMVDGVVLVVDQQETARQLVKLARGRLAFARAKVLGVVLNRADPSQGTFPRFVHGYHG